MEIAELAIVVPAWKPGFLVAALESIGKQKGNLHRVYLFSDGAGEETEEILLSFLNRFPTWSYHRFETNLGGTNLAAHWNRCIQQCREKWIWLFSDDDVMEEGCVQAFFDSKQRFPEQTLFRFSMKQVDEHGRFTGTKSPDQPHHSSEEFGKLRFLRAFESAAVEFVFSKQIFEEVGGFPEFPAAWCSDDAGWMLFAGKNGMKLIPGPAVHWRFSGMGISGSKRWLKQKLEAGMAFINWYNLHFPDTASEFSFRAEQIIWYRLQMVHQHYAPGFWEALKMVFRSNIPGMMNKLRCFQDLYCLCYVYHCRVVAGIRPKGLRYLLSRVLPAF